MTTSPSSGTISGTISGQVDLAVVGGGLSGLVAALTAAREGRRVALLDARAVGGRARSTDRRGFRFNQGAPALYDAGAARPILVDLGVELTGGPPRTRGGRRWYHGPSHLLPDGPSALMRTSALGARSKLVTAKLLAQAPSIDAAALRHLSFGEWLDQRRLPADVLDVVTAIVRVGTYAHSPGLMSADAAVSQLQRALVGVTYLDGGWQHIVDQLSAVAVAAGVDLHEHCAASHVGRDGADPSAAWVVTTPHGEVAAANVVLAGLGPHEAARLLGSVPEELGWASTGPEMRASCLDLGVSRSASSPVLFGVDEPLYLSTHTPPAGLVSDEVAAAGGGVVQLLRYLAADETPDPDTTRAELATHARRVGLDPAGGEGSGVVEQRYLHVMTVAHSMPTAANGGLPGRPPTAVDGRPGLYVAGDWVGPVGLLADATVASARDAAMQAVRRSITVAP
ncbi:MAG: phytoene desaturase family protein [Acidimicrobiales bacterium]